MKYLKTLDFVGQSIIFGAYIIGSLWILIAEQRWNSLAMTTAYAMLLLGCWQMISGLLMLVLKASLRKQRLIHFFTAIIYLAILLIVAKYSNGTQFESVAYIVRGLIITLMIGTPIGLAIFYYSITWRWMFPARSNGKFLPHISF